MVERDPDLVVAVLQVRIEGTQSFWLGEPLVADQPAGKGGNVGSCEDIELLFQFTAYKEELSLVMIAFPFRRFLQQEMKDFRLGFLGNLSEFITIDGNFPPSDERNTAPGHDGVGSRTNIILSSLIRAGEEKDSYRQITVILQVLPHRTHGLAEERIGDLG